MSILWKIFLIFIAYLTQMQKITFIFLSLKIIWYSPLKKFYGAKFCTKVPSVLKNGVNCIWEQKYFPYFLSFDGLTPGFENNGNDVGVPLPCRCLCQKTASTTYFCVALGQGQWQGQMQRHFFSLGKDKAKILLGNGNGNSDAKSVAFKSLHYLQYMKRYEP